MRTTIALFFICGACHTAQPQPHITIVAHGIGEPEAPPDTTTHDFVEGRVTEKCTGRALARHHVRWVFDYRPARTGELAGRIFEKTRTDSRGRYRLPVPPTVEGILSFGVEDGLGWRILRSTNFLDPEIDGTVFDLAARLRDRDIRVRIVDTERRPIRGAEVRLVIRGEGGPVPGLAPLKTGPDGTVATGAIELGGYWADVSAPGYATARMCPYQFDVGDKSFVDVVLEKSIRIRGQVVGEHGRTPADLHVAVGYVCKPKMGWYRWFVSVTEDGHFVADVPEGEAFQIQWTASGHEGHSKSQKATRSPDGRVVCRDFD